MRLKAKIFAILSVMILGIVGAPVLSFAQIPDGRTEGGDHKSSSKCDKPGDEFCPADKFCYINGLCVPKPDPSIGGLRGAGSVFEVIAIVFRWLLTFAGVISILFVIFGGYQYITAAGSEEQSEKGKKTLVNAIIGLIAVILSAAIVTIVTNTLGSTEPLGVNSKTLRIS